VSKFDYKIVDIAEYTTDFETQLNNIGNDGWELLNIYNSQALFVSGASGINVTGSVILPTGTVSSSVQTTNALNYGQWFSTIIHSGSENTAYPITFNSESLSRGFVLTNDSHISAQQSGVYSISLFANTRTVNGGTNINYDVWVRKDGTDIGWSNKTFYLPSSLFNLSGSHFTTFNFITSLTSGSYIEIMWNAKRTQGSINAGHTGSFEFYPITGSLIDPTRPNIPSATITITQVG